MPRRGPVLPLTGKPTRGRHFPRRFHRHLSLSLPSSPKAAPFCGPPIRLETAAARPYAASRQTAGASGDSLPGATNSSCGNVVGTGESV